MATSKNPENHEEDLISVPESSFSDEKATAEVLEVAILGSENSGGGTAMTPIMAETILLAAVRFANGNIIARQHAERAIQAVDIGLLGSVHTIGPWYYRNAIQDSIDLSCPCSFTIATSTGCCIHRDKYVVECCSQNIPGVTLMPSMVGRATLLLKMALSTERRLPDVLCKKAKAYAADIFGYYKRRTKPFVGKKYIRHHVRTAVDAFAEAILQEYAHFLISLACVYDENPQAFENTANVMKRLRRWPKLRVPEEDK